LQLGVVECKVDFDRLLQLYMSDQTEEDNNMSWECHKVVNYCKEEGDVNSSNHKHLVEWNDINKTNHGRVLIFLIKS
jgi:hypothetical protein